VTTVDTNRKRLRFANGTQVDFDVLAYVPPHRAPAVIRESGLTGDVVAIPLALGKPLPKASVFANREAEVVAENIAHAIAGQVQAASAVAIATRNQRPR
jgi:sulfide:quinone oxidoreductase